MNRLIPAPEYIEKESGICKNTENITINIIPEKYGDEEYCLNIRVDEIIISAGTENGLFYGKKTLELLKILNKTLFCCKITDKPMFRHRGFMIDSARHMQSVDELKKIIDLASLLKFNKFHWHLSDDQGFRIESEKFPMLTELSSVRKCDNFGKFCNSSEKYSGYYTKNEIKDIIKYAAERHIDIIPEIDFPGHTSAILNAFPQYSCNGNNIEVKTRQGIYKDIICCGNDDAINFLKQLFDEICDIFPGEYIHLGGDEAPKDYWCKCTYCQNRKKQLGLKNENELQIWLINEIAAYICKRNKKCIVWNDILKGGQISSSMTVQRWMDIKHKSIKAAANGSDIIISNFSPYYLDYSYGQYSLKKVFCFDPIKHEYRNVKEKILGVETPIWTEFINNDKKLENQLIPRIFAVAEYAWNGKINKSEYTLFKNSCIILSEYLKQKDYYPANEDMWDMNIFRRLKDIILFYAKFIYKKKV